jgi:hypothetical protein
MAQAQIDIKAASMKQFIEKVQKFVARAREP